MEALGEAKFFIDGSRIDSSIDLVLESLLHNMTSNETEPSSTQFPKMPLPAPLALDGVIVPTSLDEAVITVQDLRAVAQKCLISILRCCNALSLKSLMISIFRYTEN